MAARAHRTASTGGRHVAALDGLRGTAALLVVLHHALLTTTAFAAPYLDGTPSSVDGIMWWLSYTPLHGFWAGTEAVLVFFVLSGYVLTLPFSDRPMSPSDALSYYPKRLVRLYVPVWAVLVLAYALTLAIPRVGEGGSGWLQRHSDVSLPGAAQDGTLLLGLDSLITALWSLKWEVAFSLALPALLWLTHLVHRRLMVTATTLLVAAAVGWATGFQPLMFGPAFGFGVLAAIERDKLHEFAERMSAGSHARTRWALLAFVALTGFSAYWTLLGITGPGSMVTTVGRTVEIAAAALIVFLALHWRPFRSLLETPSSRWLGSRSFSLYLVHEPIIVAIAFASAADHGANVTVLAGIPIALLAAECFFRIVEAPSHRLSRWAGRATSRATTPRAARDIDSIAIPSSRPVERAS